MKDLSLRRTDGSVREEGLGLVIEALKRLAKMEREIVPSEVANLSILREAQKKLGIKDAVAKRRSEAR